MILGFTGHRPNRLGGFTPCAKKKLYRFAHRILLKLDTDVTIVQGCALGFDQAIATAAIEQGHKVISMIPYLGFNARWPVESVFELDGILNRSSEVRVCIDKETFELIDNPAFALNFRNEKIVDEADTLFALACGAPSGTQNCVDYALRQNKRVVYLWRDWLSFKETGKFATNRK
ncbi:putative ssDNA binding protein [Dickeya phage vB_DsoM_JA33]|uniref:Putative ssDNA binding protein n=3 Tax=Salmondvirus JA11 TaxID=2734141 RepID=A0A384ZWF4_9CAUD|nr:GTP-binding domain [Dickeya phage vB_DsoM_JA11]AXG66578.1 putative ssDNA binding protein [Dickeya phage vB_DsoM_JA13]AXG67549.1 putative ssDNA binding protein [Dickeya phage vB_DsoM_JA33]AYD79980.1 putative ssDNA binding protein [Dickeya phage vB_DsoM_JA11]